MNVAKNSVELVGSTPMVQIEDNIYGKCEFLNPYGSVKDRIALHMIETALDEGKIDSQSTIIEPTSGNTGIALAAVCA
ncbi:MAG: pyridoxal-phosphate dependent enzyme, partial [Campylobacterota bacterium]